MRTVIATDATVRERPSSGHGKRPARSAHEHRYAVSPTVRQAADHDGLVLLDIATGTYWTFNNVGAFAWEQINKGNPETGIVRELCKKFDKPEAEISRDVQALLSELEGLGLIQRRDVVVAVRESYVNDAVHAATVSLGRDASEPSRHDGPVTRYLWNAACFVTLVYVDVLTNLFGFKRLHAVVQKSRPVGNAYRRTTVERVSRAMDRAARAYFKHAWCLQRSAACVYILRRLGYPVDLVLGVRTIPFEAHAWAELDGEPINDARAEVERFLVLDRI